jgi:hypothetical protein
MCRRGEDPLALDRVQIEHEARHHRHG